MVGLGVVAVMGVAVGVCVVVGCGCIRNTAASASSINTTAIPITNVLFMVRDIVGVKIYYHI